MATEVWASLVTARLKLSDPNEDIINIISVDSLANFPTIPASQTAYRAEDTGIYYIYSGSYTETELQISDDRLNSLIASYGINGAVQRAINIILASLYRKRPAVRIDSGAESTQYQTLNDLIALYKELQAQYAEEDKKDTATNTGRIMYTCPAKVGGSIW